MTTDMKPIHPGEVLLEVYMKPAIPPVTVELLSRTMGVPEQVLADLIEGHRSITPSLAMQLSVICRTTPDYWLQLQKAYNRQTAKRKNRRPRRPSGTNGHPAAAA
ncbi:MAG TPA: HigA family addiction module antitoxin [Nitrospira sp.]|nr:HigA family addiction module antitoxin [Nitrospira sp.]